MPTSAAPRYRELRREDLAHRLDYDLETGQVSWKPRTADDFQPPRAEAKAAAWNGRFAGRPATCRNQSGYLVVQMDRVPYLAHRVAVALRDGVCPADKQVDHLNGVRTDNRAGNLRVVDPMANQWNRHTHSPDDPAGIKATTDSAGVDRWEVRLRFQGALVYLGTYGSYEEAVAARRAGERVAKVAAGSEHADHPLL